MSDKEEASTANEETNTTKRPHEPENQAEDEDESNDGWVGPLPTDAAPVKKRKGIFDATLLFAWIKL